MSDAKHRRRVWRLPSRAILQWWEIHSWAGVGGGLVLYIMFVAGATVLFHHELETWEEPIHQRAAPMVRPLEPALAQIYRVLRDGEDPAVAPVSAVRAEGEAEAEKPDAADEVGDPRDAAKLEAAESSSAAKSQAGDAAGPTKPRPTASTFWFFPPAPGHGEAATAYQDTAGTWHTAYLDGRTGELLPQRERLAHFLYGLHYLWHDLTGQWLYTVAGLLAVAFLMIVITGVLVHWKNLSRQLHQFRPDKSRRILWADLHKVLGVLGLPFQIMYAYTGAMLVLAPLIAQLLAGPLFGGDDQRASAVVTGPMYEDPMLPGPWLRDVRPASSPASHALPRGTLGLPLDELVARARARAPRMEPDAVQIVHPGYAHGYVEISGYDSSKVPEGRTVVIVRAATGEILTPPASLQSSPAETARRWVRGLHIVHFGGFGTRVLFFLLTLAGCATILTGNALWLVRREEKAASLSNRVLAKLTAGVGAGLWVAMGAMVVASRILPWGLEGRGALEEGLFFAVLVGCVVWALAARCHAHTWWRQLAVAAVLLASAPLLAALHSGAGALGGLHVPAPGEAEQVATMAEVVGVDVAMWLLALVLGCCAFWLRKVARRLDAAEEGAGGAVTGSAAVAADAAAKGAESVVTKSAGDSDAEGAAVKSAASTNAAGGTP